MTDKLHEPPRVAGVGTVSPQPGSELTELEAGVPDHISSALEQGLEVKARSQWSYARSRFFRHRLAMASIVILVIVFAAGIFAGQLAPYDPTLPSADITQTPTFAGHHFFGTDQIGRDYFSRTLYGIRASEQVSLLVAAIATVIGILIGACSGYFGGWLDNLLMRTTDLFLIVPPLAVLLVAAKYLGHGSPVRLALLLGLLFWPYSARRGRGSFLSLKEKEYVEAAKASGSGNFRIMFRHILPNTMGPIVVAATLLTGLAILSESTISFLGFGLDLSLGSLIQEGQAAGLNLWWLVTMPGLTIVLIILCVNFIGDGLRDALDPTQRRIRA
jgi:ABC-type dipeptide/oligopeptide/nickel transport system permease subunit